MSSLTSYISKILSKNVDMVITKRERDHSPNKRPEEPKKLPFGKVTRTHLTLPKPD